MPPKEAAKVLDAKEQAELDAVLYNKNLRANVETDVNERPRALVHSREWARDHGRRPSGDQPGGRLWLQDHVCGRVVRALEAQRRLSRLPQLRQPEHKGAPLHPGGARSPDRQPFKE